MLFVSLLVTSADVYYDGEVDIDSDDSDYSTDSSDGEADVDSLEVKQKTKYNT